MSKADEEYQLQLFSFTVKELQQNQREIIEHRVTNMVNDAVTSIIADHPELATGCQAAGSAVTDGIMRTSGDTLRRLDAKIAETFTIPAHVVLPEDQLLAKYGGSAADEQQLVDELQRLQLEFNQQSQFMTVLDEELQLHGRLEAAVERELEIMGRVERSLQLSSTSTEGCRTCVRHLKEAFRPSSPAK